MQPTEAFDQLVQIALTNGLPSVEHFLTWLGLEVASIIVSAMVGVLFLGPIYLGIWGLWRFLKAFIRRGIEQRL